MVTLISGLTFDQAHTYGLVLAATGIDYQMVNAGQCWQIRIKTADQDGARAALGAYLAENPPTQAAEANEQPPPRFSLGAGIYAAVLLLAIHVAIMAGNDQSTYLLAYGASARRIMQGEVYRCVTALVLHADAFHLAGNMVAVAILGSAVCAQAGWGVGWGLILTSGVLGNLLAALLYQTGHLAVGASTAVFGAVGCLAGMLLSRPVQRPRGRIRLFAPLAAGLGLLAMLGTSQGSDLVAHLAGFVVGLGLGLVHGFILSQPASSRFQWVVFASVVVVLTTAWLKGFQFSG